MSNYTLIGLIDVTPKTHQWLNERLNSTALHCVPYFTPRSLAVKLENEAGLNPQVSAKKGQEGSERSIDGCREMKVRMWTAKQRKVGESRNKNGDSPPVELCTLIPVLRDVLPMNPLSSPALEGWFSISTSRFQPLSSSSLRASSPFICLLCQLLCLNTQFSRNVLQWDFLIVCFLLIFNHPPFPYFSSFIDISSFLVMCKKKYHPWWLQNVAILFLCCVHTKSPNHFKVQFKIN